MNYNNLLLAFKQITPDFTQAELEQITPLLSKSSYKKNEHIVLAGQMSRKVNFVYSGSCRMYYSDKESFEKNIILAIEGHFIHDLESLIMNKPSTYHIEALEDSEIISIDYEKFDILLNSTKNWEHCGRMINQYVLVGVFRYVHALWTLSPEERYLKLFEEEPFLFNRFSLEHIASYLGIKRESLSRIRKRIASQKRF